MPEFFHERTDVKTIIESIAHDLDIAEAVVEKDYWIMHCLMQAICRRYRQHRERNDPEKDRPREFLRHYYDLYILLEAPRVKAFIGTDEYAAYKKLKFRPSDGKYFDTRKPYKLDEAKICDFFEQEFSRMNAMLLAPAPEFKDLIERLREYAPKF
ncbi:MAG: hypothetical protein HY922_06690 [Elusimicrobia bacterium]|nr:hypothetical protein [Elusimicrobiota bacterium]